MRVLLSERQDYDSSHLDADIPQCSAAPQLIPAHLILQALGKSFHRLPPLGWSISQFSGNNLVMAKLPFPTHSVQNTLRRQYGDLALISNDLHGGAERGALDMACLCGEELLLPAPNVFDDRDVARAVEIYLTTVLEFLLSHVQAHGEAHQGGQKSIFDVKRILSSDRESKLTLFRHRAHGTGGMLQET